MHTSRCILYEEVFPVNWVFRLIGQISRNGDEPILPLSRILVFDGKYPDQVWAQALSKGLTEHGRRITIVTNIQNEFFTRKIHEFRHFFLS